MGADVAAEEPFGPYLVYERLGVGGMATVHRALERGIEGFERIVALKRLLPHLAADASFIKSFVREAKLASLLNHVNIVQIFELGRVGTQYFISMEYIDGRDIRRILRHARKVSGPPAIHVTVGLLLQLCEALDYAHHKADENGHPLGIVHRDVSPSNVLVTSAGQVKIIDFGIARAQSSQLRTQTGRVKGKLAYMAPEALAGKDLDARSDLFAVGVIAHELLTARPLFAAKNEYQTLMKVQRGEIMPPSTFNQGCPPELDAIVLRALASDPDDRFDNAGDLRDQLHALRKQYNLQTADRDVASWLDWAFSLEVPGGFAGNTGNTDQPNTDLGSRGRVRQARARRIEEDDDGEHAWGGHDEHGSGEPIVLDEVPDVSSKALHHASALGAEARVTLDDLADFADDIPTPLPSHGRPTVDLAPPRTRTPLLKPRPGTRKKSPSAAPLRRGPVATPDDGPAIAAVPAAAGDDGATAVDAAAIDIGAGVVPSRARTMAIPPRAIPAGSAPPRNVPAGAQPPRAAPAIAEPSRPIPVVAQVRSAVIPPAPARSSDFAEEPSRRVVVADVSRGISDASRPVVAATGTLRGNAFAEEPSRRVVVADIPRPAGAPEPSRPIAARAGDFADEPSRRVAAADVARPAGASEPSRPVRVPVGTSRGNDFADEPSRRAAAADVARRGDFADEPSRRVAAADVARRGDFADEPSRRVAAADVARPAGPAEPARPVRVPVGTSRGNDFADEPSRRVAAADVAREPLRPTPLVNRPASAAAVHPRTIPASSTPPRERRGTAPGTGTPQPVEPARSGPGRDTLLDMAATERRPTFRIEDLGLPNDTMPAMPAMQTSESVVRFREPTQPPPVEPRREPTPPPSLEPAPAPAPAAAAPAPEPTTSTRRRRLITPATALFAEPDPDAASTITTSHGFGGASQATIPDLAAHEPRRSTAARVVIAVAVLALVSAATAAAALYLTRDDRRSVEPRPTPAPAPVRTGTVRIEVTPADAAITIGGNLRHSGAPWDAVLDAGSYQIEIHRDGYMGWLTSIELVAGQNQTLQVALEPLGSAIAAEATLIFGSTPPGLEIAIDGAVVGKTPDKRTIPAGRHNLALRAGGSDVWRRDIDAHASAVYEFRPTIGGAAPSPGGEPAPAGSPTPPAEPPPAPPTPSADRAPGAAGSGS